MTSPSLMGGRRHQTARANSLNLGKHQTLVYTYHRQNTHTNLPDTNRKVVTDTATPHRWKHKSKDGGFYVLRFVFLYFHYWFQHKLNKTICQYIFQIISRIIFNIICNIIKERREEGGWRHFRRCKSISQLRTIFFFNSFSTLFNTPVIVDRQLYGWWIWIFFLALLGDTSALKWEYHLILGHHSSSCEYSNIKG